MTAEPKTNRDTHSETIRLEKAFAALAETDDKAMVASAVKHSRTALARSEKAMSYQQDIEMSRQVARFSET